MASPIGLVQQDGESKVVVRQSCLRGEPRVATRIGLVQQDGGSKVEANTIRYSAAISACEKRQEWQLGMGCLSRMAKTKKNSKVKADAICYRAAAKGPCPTTPAIQGSKVAASEVVYVAISPEVIHHCTNG